MVIMREAGPTGPNSDVLWIGHGTNLLRAAPEHVKSANVAIDITEKPRGPLGHCKECPAPDQEPWSDAVCGPLQDEQTSTR